MPIYIYENIQTGEVKEVYQSVHDKHEYSEKGVSFKRIFTIPTASSNTKLDPFDKAGFIRKLDGKYNETIGNTMDRAAELSAQRAERLGKDPLKEKFYADFEKRHKGKLHPQKVKEESAPNIEKLKELGINVKL